MPMSQSKVLHCVCVLLPCRDEGDLRIPEDTRPSPEEEEHLQKQIGEMEMNVFSHILPQFIIHHPVQLTVESGPEEQRI